MTPEAQWPVKTKKKSEGKTIPAKAAGAVNQEFVCISDAEITKPSKSPEIRKVP